MTQDIFVRTWQKLGQFRGDSAFSTWLHRLAVNVVLERRRTFAIQRARLTDDPDAIESITVGPARADLKVDYEQALEQLPPGAREVFVLHDVEGCKHRRDRGDARHRERHVEAATSSGANADASASEWSYDDA